MMDDQHIWRENAGEWCSVTPMMSAALVEVGQWEQYHPQQGMESLAIFPEQELQEQLSFALVCHCSYV